MPIFFATQSYVSVAPGIHPTFGLDSRRASVQRSPHHQILIRVLYAIALFDRDVSQQCCRTCG